MRCDLYYNLTIFLSRCILLVVMLFVMLMTIAPPILICMTLTAALVLGPRSLICDRSIAQKRE